MVSSVLAATSNPHKLEELRAILAPRGTGIYGLADVPGALELAEPEESADTFLGNASIKASYYAERTGRPTIADDSGLVVDALDGRPGVHSARYAGVEGSREDRDRANNAKLLQELEGVPEKRRKARFVCVIAVAAPTGAILGHVEAAFEGVIGTEPRGENGFGYDPLLVLPEGMTSAELPTEEKNRRSHRAQAAAILAQRLPLLFRDF